MTKNNINNYIFNDKALISHSSVQTNRADAQLSDMCSIFPLGL